MSLPKAEKTALFRRKLKDPDYQWLRAVDKI